MNEVYRWSRYQYRGRNQPKGSPDALHRALLAVGPLTNEHQPHLLALCPCEQCVEKNIRNVAAAFNARTLVIEGAPRKKTVADNLRRAQDSARAFAETLLALDDYSRHLLDVPHEYLEDDGHSTRLYKAARGEDLPKPETKNAPAQDGSLVEQLRALEKYFNERLGQFRGYDDEVDASFDKGGNTNLMKDQMGPPALHLVRDCWYFFQNLKPKQATGSENGPFLHFVNCVYEYATGELEENSTILNWTKKLARLLRHHDELLQKLGPLECELDDLKLDAPTPVRDQRIAQLEADLPGLRDEVVAAFMATSLR